MYSALSTFNTTTEVPLNKAPNPQLLPGRRSKNGCPVLRVCVCVHCCVCALWMGQMRPYLAVCHTIFFIDCNSLALSEMDSGKHFMCTYKKKKRKNKTPPSIQYSISVANTPPSWNKIGSNFRFLGVGAHGGHKRTHFRQNMRERVMQGALNKEAFLNVELLKRCDNGF